MNIVDEKIGNATKYHVRNDENEIDLYGLLGEKIRGSKLRDDLDMADRYGTDVQFQIIYIPHCHTFICRLNVFLADYHFHCIHLMLQDPTLTGKYKVDVF